ncbi:MAG TPA: 2'-5' RNA ligase family protein [Bryobacteraceae bacterium]|jgi:2'-5' RNA ligase|nr:2'-5' RNA ligase family protein [Bryobacteraceae bacterium]
MSIARGEARTVSQFALVSYVPAPLSGFLDHLRIRLTPQAKPHAHVTILPPRPVYGDLEELKKKLAPALRDVNPFQITLGSIKVFPVSNVIYLSIDEGEARLRELNRALDRDDLRFKTPFSYHPHITLAQDIPPPDVERLRAAAQEDWEAWRGERTFLVDSLWLVQNVMPDVWLECGRFPLAVEAPVPG